MKLIIFGGTTEGRELSERMAAAGALVTVCVATEYGCETQPSGEHLAVRVGPMTAAEKQALLRGADLCVDATHPYASHITASVLEACEAVGTPYRRLLRSESEADGAIVFESAAEVAAYLQEREGNILLTTGAKELPAFAALDPARLYPRVLASHAALDACEAIGVPRKNIIAMQGPFSQELNEAILRQFEIRFLVTKDGGAPGGFPEKAAAAAAVGAELILLRRPEETGNTFEDILALCLNIQDNI